MITTLGEYRVEAVIGRGSMGQVVRAAGASMPVAIKLIDSHITVNPEFKRRFMELAQMVTALKHPNIARVFHGGEQDGISYIVSELVTGGSLDTMRPALATREWDRSQWAAVDLVRQVADGLAAAHNRKIVHGDVKLSNLLLQRTESGTPQVKITDFGLTALNRDTQATRLPASDNGLSGEQDDLYALGGVLYEVTTGRATLLRRGPTAYVNSAYAVTPPSQILSGYPPDLEAVVMRCLAADPQQRFASCNALSSGLAALVQTWVRSGSPPVRPPSGMTPKANDPNLTVPAAMLNGRRPPKPPDGPSPESVPCVCILDEAGDRIASKFVRGTTGITIGRSASSDLVLPSDQVSESHARITWDGNRVMVTDLGSRNSTFLQGQRLLPQVTQEWGEEQWLQVGPYWVWLQPPKAVPAEGSVEVLLDQPTRMMSVTPGKPTPCTFKLVNQKTKVDRVQVVVDGIPADWVEGTRRDIRLQPFETREVSLAINVPKTPDARAGAYPVTIRPESTADPDKDQKAATAHWTVLPFYAASVSINPTKGRGRSSAKYKVTLRNDGNIESSYSLNASDDDKQLEYTFSNEQQSEQSRLQFKLEPGSKSVARMHVKAPRLWIGQATTHPFGVVAQAKGDGESPATEAQFTNAPVFPAWMLVVAPLVLVALLWWGFRLAQPEVLAVYLEPAQPVIGQPVTVGWRATNARELGVLVNDVPERRAPAPEDQTYPFPQGFQRDTRVRVVGSNLFGEHSREVTVTVLPPGPARLPVVELSVVPNKITLGQSVTITWKVADGARAMLDPIGNVPLEGSRTDKPTANQTYTLTGFNVDEKSTTAKANVLVVPLRPNAALLSLTASTNRVGVGDSVTFEWKAANATSVRIESSLIPTPLQGVTGRTQARLRGQGTYEFTLVATDDQGGEVRSEKVVVEARCGLVRRIIVFPCNRQPQLEWVGGN